MNAVAPAPVSRFIPLAMASALFMDLLDTAALGSALPTMAREFHTEALHLKLALTAYLVTMAILVPASGWLADRYGARRVFINAMKIYLIGSLCCGLSRSVAQLVASHERLHPARHHRTADGAAAGRLLVGSRQLAMDISHQLAGGAARDRGGAADRAATAAQAPGSLRRVRLCLGRRRHRRAAGAVGIRWIR
jgi:MFS family permease